MTCTGPVLVQSVKGVPVGFKLAGVHPELPPLLVMAKVIRVRTVGEESNEVGVGPETTVLAS